jgi:hypothetical protein
MALVSITTIVIVTTTIVVAAPGGRDHDTRRCVDGCVFRAKWMKKPFFNQPQIGF